MNLDASSVLFGAFDRHNFGDLLFPHLLEALLPGQAFGFAGLATRDLRPFGGHRVRPLPARPRQLIHAGGELLTCSAWQAAVMLLDPAEAAAAIARYDADPAAAAAWAARQLGTTRTMPYVVGRDALAPGGRLIFNAVGGVEWNVLAAAQREEVKTALRSADWLSVRDHVTQAALRAEGIAAPLCPDPAVVVEQCFGELIRRHWQQGAAKAIRDAFPRGYLACQFSADFADDASLDGLAQGLSKVVAATGLGVALFRAGAAPWHDDPALYEKLQRRLPPGTARLFPSLHLWDLCALIAASRGVACSSLHGRIVALAYGLPRVSLAPPKQGSRLDKRAASAETWEPDAIPRSVAVERIEPALMQALAVPPDILHENAASLRARYLQSQAQWTGLLTP
ncbi:MAG: polysaccharide pyruvyl transferase family protein [Gammaproteobacteria bacterium]|nr:polysaccharide pyruvyl transferase family protein [Gammaproteobacteria bacterium]MBU1407700.1 polysaccharide pyruvyl transferase family protein [Gammaproteobacteria bacterium]MBU1531813.1 polysaccharide pyruvyl transferase family protein [Gammaproteobacteria bacterium]